LRSFGSIYFLSPALLSNKNTMTEPVNELVSVSSDRYAELEALEKSVPDRIKEAIAQYKKESLKKLHERDKADPESVKLRMQRYIAKNRDKINERRREKRRKEQLENGTGAGNGNGTCVGNIPLGATITDMFASLAHNDSVLANNNRLIVNNATSSPNFDMTVRFDD
jgi:hypothetical protein